MTEDDSDLVDVEKVGAVVGGGFLEELGGGAAQVVRGDVSEFGDVGSLLK